MEYPAAQLFQAAIIYSLITKHGTDQINNIVSPFVLNLEKATEIFERESSKSKVK